MGWWQEHVVPRLVDKGRSPAVSNLRIRVCAELSGDVIEIGFGSGLNVAHYPSAVRSVTLAGSTATAQWSSCRRLSHQPAHRRPPHAQRLED
jgi:hypothetical protein